VKPRVVVVGAGAFGGWAALQLLHLGADVTIIDRWGAGNAKASSGGHTRVIRSIYGPDRIYSEMVRRSYELWDDLIATTRERLYVETGALWMIEEDDAYVRASLPIVRDLGFTVDELSIADAANRYPLIDFHGVTSAYLERRAGALFAQRACEVVARAVVDAGGTLRTATITRAGEVDADYVVFACGPWLAELFPDLIRPSRQEVYYFASPPDIRLPIWLNFGKRIFYGIPDLDGRGFKFADDTRGESVDPTTMSRTHSAAGVADAREFLARRFPKIATQPLLSAEVCQYENSPDGNLIIDRHPDAKNVWIVGGGSGHGFKLAPAVGEIVAQAVLQGKEPPEMFRAERLHEARRKTQFET